MSKRVDNIDTEKPEVDTTEKVDATDKSTKYLIYPLLSPITAYGEKITFIRMRRPRGPDLLAVGNPVIFSPHVDPPRVEHNLDKVIMMVARLSEPQIPSPSLAELDPQDITGLAWTISPFFTPAR